MIRLGLIGYPVEHSRSPALHSAAFLNAKLSGEYTAHAIQPGDVRSSVQALWDAGFVGLNVTLPIKVEALDICDELSSVASKAGAVNTLLHDDDGTVYGTNTDVAGGMYPLKRHGTDLLGADVLVVGAGGAARGVIVGLLEEGVSTVWITNRTSSRAECLVNDIQDSRVKVIPLESAALAACKPSVVINATSIGLGTAPASAAEALAWFRQLPVSHWQEFVGYDLIYSKQRHSGLIGWTPFRQVVHEAGRVSIDGWEMLVRQAALSFALWTRTEVESAFRAMMTIPR